jgi:hypothetical protein
LLFVLHPTARTKRLLPFSFELVGGGELAPATEIASFWTNFASSHGPDTRALRRSSHGCRRGSRSLLILLCTFIISA